MDDPYEPLCDWTRGVIRLSGYVCFGVTFSSIR